MEGALLNLRRMNATERASIYGKFVVIVLLFILVLAVVPGLVAEWEKHNDRVPLENKTCQEIYNLSQTGKLYRDDKAAAYEPESVMIYYFENCYQKT
jgi:hypothetical protein